MRQIVIYRRAGQPEVMGERNSGICGGDLRYTCHPLDCQPTTFVHHSVNHLVLLFFIIFLEFLLSELNLYRKL